MHFACSIGQDIENAILSINTVTLYVIIFALLGLLIFLFVRNALKRHKFTATSDSYPAELHSVADRNFYFGYPECNHERSELVLSGRRRAAA